MVSLRKDYILSSHFCTQRDVASSGQDFSLYTSAIIIARATEFGSVHQLQQLLWF